jgi:thiamine-monophosphate kinase
VSNEPSPEDKLIARFFKPLATHPGALGLSDDAAFFAPPPGHDVVLKTDAILEGVHFLPGDPPEDVARKALRVNLSDLAAKGAAPSGFLLSISLPAKLDPDWLERFCAGLERDARVYHCPLFGGDTDKTPGLLAIAIFAFGIVPSGRMVRRAGAKAGDIVAVSGQIGEGTLGLRLARDPSLAARWSLTDAEHAGLVGRYRVPQPRNALSAALRDHASAAMDISDGLAGDLAKLCRVSGVTATVETGRVPFSSGASKALAAEPALLETLLSGGDDYEILCAISTDRWDAFAKAAQSSGVEVTAIGTFEAGRDAPCMIGADGKALAFARPSYSHF